MLGVPPEHGPGRCGRARGLSEESVKTTIVRAHVNGGSRGKDYLFVGRFLIPYKCLATPSIDKSALGPSVAPID